MFPDSQPRDQSKIYCTTPGCSGWVWNSRKRIAHCKLCMAPINWQASSNAKGGQAGKGKAGGAVGKGKGHNHPMGLGGPQMWSWPYFDPAMQYAAMFPPPFWQKGAAAKGKGKSGAEKGGGAAAPPWRQEPPSS